MYWKANWNLSRHLVDECGCWGEKNSVVASMVLLNPLLRKQLFKEFPIIFHEVFVLRAPRACSVNVTISTFNIIFLNIPCVTEQANAYFSIYFFGSEPSTIKIAQRNHTNVPFSSAAFSSTWVKPDRGKTNANMTYTITY
jgi:hypothetical protein